MPTPRWRPVSVAGLVALLLPIVLGLTASSAPAAFPGANGLLAIGTNEGFYTDSPSGGALTKIAEAGAGPYFSSNGTRILTTGPDGLYTMNVEGGDVVKTGVKLDRGGGDFIAPGFGYLVDGRIVYIAGDPGDKFQDQLFTMDADGSDRRQLTRDADPTIQKVSTIVSPDGETVYYRAFDRDTEESRIKAVSLATGAQREILPGVDAVAFDVSPDGRTLLYARVLDGPPSYHLRDVATGEDRVVPLDRPSLPRFSPDGTTIAYSVGVEIRGVDLDGANLRTLYVSDTGIEVWAWQPVPKLTAIIVNDSGDQPNHADSEAEDVCDVDPDEAGSQCTLRAAIELANDRDGARITFDIAGAGVPRIDVSPAEDADSGLPVITAPTEIDGTTQPGGWVEVVARTEPLVFAPGIVVEAGGGGSEVRGLVVHGFAYGELAVRANGVSVEGNRFGTDVTGTQARGALAQTRFGVAIRGNENRLADNVIAGAVNKPGDSEFDPLTGGGSHVLVIGDDNRVEGNRIGVGADGRAVVLPPLTSDHEVYVGLVVLGGRNVVGGGATAVPSGGCESPCNLIAGVTVPIAIGASPHDFSGDPTVDTEVSGNWIGVDAAGTPVLLDSEGPYGISDWSGVHEPTPKAERTVLSANLVVAESNALGVGEGGRIVANRAFGRATGFDSGGFAANLALVTAGGGAEVSGNVIRSFSNRGLIVEGSGGTTVSRNTIADNPLGGILIYSGAGHVIADNELRDNDLVGIGAVPFDDSGNPVPRAVLARNSIVGSDIGIDLFPSNGEIGSVPPWGDALPGDGVTENDTNDGDDGPNGYLNFPEALSVSGDGGALTVRGFVEAPVLGSADYLVEAYTSPTCAAAGIGGQAHGAGAHYVGVGGGTSSRGYADFTLNLTGVPTDDRVVSLTATRLDQGATSEFSRCVPLAGSGQVAQATVDAGQTGTVLDDQQATVAIPAASRRARAAGGAHGAGTLYLTRYASEPPGRLFADATAPGNAGTQVRPDAVAARYWLLTDRGLTTGGGAAEGDAATLDVCLDAGGVVDPAALDHAVVVRRSDDTQGRWQPHATTRTTHAGRPYLCAGGLTALGEFAIGTTTAASPPTPETPPTTGPENPPAGKLTPTPSAKPKAADVIRLPSSRKCVKRRKGLRVRLRAPSGDRVVRSVVKAGRKKARRLTGRRARGPLALKGKALPRRGKVKIRIQVRLSSGTDLSRSRTYRICR